MDAARPDPAALDRMVNDLLAHYDDLYRVQRERFAAVRKVVTPTQSARLLLLLPRIDDAIRRQIQRAMGGARKGARADRRASRQSTSRSRSGGAKTRAPAGRTTRRRRPFAESLSDRSADAYTLLMVGVGVACEQARVELAVRRR